MLWAFLLRLRRVQRSAMLKIRAGQYRLTVHPRSDLIPLYFLFLFIKKDLVLERYYKKSVLKKSKSTTPKDLRIVPALVTSLDSSNGRPLLRQTAAF